MTRIPTIGQQPTGVGCQDVDTARAFPVSVAIQVNGAAQIISFGGLTKLEWMAGQIAAAVWTPCGSLGDYSPPSEKMVVDYAESILAECERRQHAAKNQNGEGDK